MGFTVKKILALFLAAAFVCTVSVGCNKDSKTEVKGKTEASGGKTESKSSTGK